MSKLATLQALKFERHLFKSTADSWATLTSFLPVNTSTRFSDLHKFSDILKELFSRVILFKELQVSALTSFLTSSKYFAGML